MKIFVQFYLIFHFTILRSWVRYGEKSDTTFPFIHAENNPSQKKNK